MRRTVTAFCIAAAFGVVATLETPNSVVAAFQSSGGASNVKVTGCVDKDPTGKLILLTSAVVEPAPATATLPDSLKNVTTFQLTGSGLESHISEKVEITGSATPPPAPPPSTTTAPAATDTPAPRAGRGAANAPKPGSLDVKSLKMIHTYPCF